MTGFGFRDILVEIYRQFSRGDVDGATQTFYRYCPLIRFEAQEGLSLAVRKRIYYLRGAIASSQARSPSMPMDEETSSDLDDLLTRLDLI